MEKINTIESLRRLITEMLFEKSINGRQLSSKEITLLSEMANLVKTDATIRTVELQLSNNNPARDLAGKVRGKMAELQTTTCDDENIKQTAIERLNSIAELLEDYDYSKLYSDFYDCFQSQKANALERCLSALAYSNDDLTFYDKPLLSINRKPINKTNIKKPLSKNVSINYGLLRELFDLLFNSNVYEELSTYFKENPAPDYSGSISLLTEKNNKLLIKITILYIISNYNKQSHQEYATPRELQLIMNEVEEYKKRHSGFIHIIKLFYPRYALRDKREKERLTEQVDAYDKKNKSRKEALEGLYNLCAAAMTSQKLSDEQKSIIESYFNNEIESSHKHSDGIIRTDIENIRTIIEQNNDSIRKLNQELVQSEETARSYAEKTKDLDPITMQLLMSDYRTAFNLIKVFSGEGSMEEIAYEETDDEYITGSRDISYKTPSYLSPIIALLILGYLDLINNAPLEDISEYTDEDVVSLINERINEKNGSLLRTIGVILALDKPADILSYTNNINYTQDNILAFGGIGL